MNQRLAACRTPLLLSISAGLQHFPPTVPGSADSYRHLRGARWPWRSAVSASRILGFAFSAMARGVRPARVSPTH